jgi:hypothetical protein
MRLSSGEYAGRKLRMSPCLAHLGKGRGKLERKALLLCAGILSKMTELKLPVAVCAKLPKTFKFQGPVARSGPECAGVHPVVLRVGSDGGEAAAAQCDPATVLHDALRCV